MFRSRITLLGAAALLCAIGFVPRVFADDTATETEKAKAVEVDQKLPAFTMTDRAGKALDLHDCGVTKKDAEAVVMAAAKKLGVKEPKADTKIADLPGMMDEDEEIDLAKVAEFASSVGSYFGLIAFEDSVERFATLGDLSTWIAKADKSPIVVMTWSPKCPTVRRTYEQIVAAMASNDIRIYALGCNTRDTDEMYDEFVEAMGFQVRIFPDRDQKVTDILGGKVTPHFFVIDADAKLRYKGALNDDPMNFKDEEERVDYVVDAVKAIRGGTDVPTKTSEPAG
jgi:peroxiredoxin